MQAIATISPATYALDGIREAILDGQASRRCGTSRAADDHRRGLDPARPVGLPARRASHAKKHGKLKRSG